MKSICLPRITPALLPLVFALTDLRAQTANWMGPAATNPATVADWSNGAHWSTGAVPSGSGATAVFQDGILGDATSPLRVRAGFTESGTTELGGIRFNSAGGTDARRVWPEILLSNSAAHTLRLTGSGLAVPVPAPSAPLITLGFGTTLEFANSAGISGVAPLYGGDGHVLQLRNAQGSTLRFRDRSHAGFSELLVSQDARLEFTGQSSAGTALILASGRIYSPNLALLPLPDPNQGQALITFNEQSSLDRALIRTGSRVEFHDTSTAANGVIQSAGEIWFFDQSSSGRALLGSPNTVFTDRSSGGNALLWGGSVEFRGQSTAGQAWIRGVSARFRDSASAGSAFEIDVNRLEVLDQADLSGAQMVTARLVDLSGARTTGGTSQRVMAGSAGASGTIMADNPIEVRIRRLRVFSGDLQLGSNTLVLVDGAQLHARITDTGGTYRDQLNRDFTGGGLVIRGGFAQVSHPENNYSGETRVESGTLSLVGGALSNTVVNQHAVLHGSGTIRGYLINNGTVNTDLPSLGANRSFTVQGDYHQGVTGNLQMRMRTDDRNTLNIAGQATLAGGILHFYGGEPFSADATIGFFNASSRSGQWAAINLPGVAAGFAARVRYTATGAQLVIEPAATSSSLHGASLAPDEQLVVLTPLGYRTDTEVRSLFGLGAAPVETLVQAVAAHDPAAYSLLPAGSRLSALALQQDVEKFSRTDPGVLPERTLILVGELQQRRESFAPAAGPSGDGRAGGFVSGGIWRADAITVGGLLAYESARHTPAPGGTFSLDRVSPGLFARAGLGDTFVAVSATYTHEEYDLSRPIVFPGTNLVARAAPRAGRIDAGVLAGHSFRFGPCLLVPSAGVFATRWRLNDASESGVPAGAAVLQGWRDRALLARLGVDLGADLLDQRVTARLSLRWLHELDSARELGVRFAGLPDNFALTGLPVDTDLFQASLRGECRFGRRLTASLSAGLTHGRTARITSELGGGLRWEF